jgi:hypothetical protein
LGQRGKDFIHIPFPFVIGKLKKKSEDRKGPPGKHFPRIPFSVARGENREEEKAPLVWLFL